MEAYQEAVYANTSAGQNAVSAAQAGVAAMSPEITEAVVIPPQLIEVLSAYQRAVRQSEPDRMQAERMDRIIEAIRAPSRDTDAPTPAPVQISIVINGDPSPETIDRLEEFIYSDAFEERVTEVTEQAQRDAARRRY